MKIATLSNLSKFWTKAKEYITNAIAAAVNDLKSSISAVYTPKGSVQSYSELPEDAQPGDVYDVQEAFDIDGKHYPAGTNVARTSDGKWDPLGGIFDTSGLLKSEDLEEISESEIDDLFKE